MPSPVDRIGDRLDRPELVPAELRHLVPDDQQRVKRILSFPVSGRVLDVGCSDGAITRRIKATWKTETWGADLRTQVWEDCGYIIWDMRDAWPTRANIPAFDAIYACEVFEHLTDADASNALRNIMELLKPGGDLIVTVPNRHPHDLYEVGCRSRWAWPDHRSSWTWGKLYSFLAPYFTHDSWWEPVSLYDHEPHADSIWLIARAKGRT